MARQFNDAQLLHHAQVVAVIPVLTNPAARAAENVDLLNGHLLVGRLDPEEVPLVGSPIRVSKSNFVPSRKHVFEGHVEIGESLPKNRDCLFKSSGSGRLVRSGIVVNEIWSEDLIYDSQFSLIEYFVHEPRG